MDFESLVEHISTIQNTLQAQAAHAVNLALTARNWLMGCYIVEFEQNGEDRAAYGEQLLKKLEQRLKTKGLNERRFRGGLSGVSHYRLRGNLCCAGAEHRSGR